MAERRTLTIVFCDIVGWTALSEQLDPEDLGLLQRRYQTLCDRVIRRLGGFVAAYAGDGVMAYFGYPKAWGNDAERAVRAGLEIVGDLQHLEVRTRRGSLPRLAGRVGIHTGLVIVTPMGRRERREPYAVVGEASNLAARLQAEAAPNSVLISEATLALVPGLFLTQARGARRIRGLSRLVRVHEVVAPATLPRRGLLPARRGAAQLVGRDRELRRLRQAWAAVRRLRGLRTVLVTGEAGIGKSRLVAELARLPAREPMNRVQLACLELYRTTPLHPVIALIQAEARIEPGDAPEAVRTKLAHRLGEQGLPVAAVEPLAPLLGLPASGSLTGLTPL
jgi:class 3 adenylate cyclase